MLTMKTNFSMIFKIIILLSIVFVEQSVAEEDLPIEPKQRLLALQNALIKTAMESQTRVKSAAWMDSSGKLHENTRITSDMEVSGVRVLSYLQSKNGNSAEITTGQKLIINKDKSCKSVSNRYRKVSTIDTGLFLNISDGEKYVWNRLLTQVRKRIQSNYNTSGKWLINSATLVQETTYDSIFTGSRDNSPYQMFVEILPPGALGIEPVRPNNANENGLKKLIKFSKNYLSDNNRNNPSKPFVMRLSIFERKNQFLIWQKSIPLFFPETKIEYNSKPLPPGLLSELDRILLLWQNQIDKDFKCIPNQFNVKVEGENILIINGGKSSGLMVGDQLLLMNREHLPSRILEPESNKHLALAKVTRVEAEVAYLEKLAGPSENNIIGDWVATPF
mgnify:FL=1